MRYYWVAPLLAVAGLAVAFRLQHHVIGDLQVDLEVYRSGIRTWWRGGDLYGELPPVADGGRIRFIYPPFGAVVLTPLALLPWGGATMVLFALSVLALAVTLYLVARRLWTARTATMVAAAAVPLSLFLEPVHQTFHFGQVNLLLMGIVAVDCLAGRPWWPRGVGVGSAAAIKIMPAAFVLYFLVRKDCRAAATAAITGAVATAIGFAVSPGASARYWFGGLAGAGDVSGVPFRGNQSWQAVLVRTGLPPTITTVCWLALVAVLLAVTVRAARRADPPQAFVVVAVFMLLASPTSWSHHWVWVAPALLVMIGCARSRPAWLGAAAVTTALFVLAPFDRLPGFHDVELAWTPGQQLAGALYAVLATILLALYAFRTAAPRERAASP
jgi:alpha-1,2-mannosyltransferase